MPLLWNFFQTPLLWIFSDAPALKFFFRCPCFGIFFRRPCVGIFYIFIPVNANPTLLCLITLSACILSTFSCLLLIRATGPCFLLAEISCEFYAAFFDHWPILNCLVLVRHQQQANQLLSSGNFTPHAIRNGGCKNRRIYISNWCILSIYRKEFLFF